MAALIKAANAKIRANPTLNYVCSTRKSSSVPILHPQKAIQQTLNQHVLSRLRESENHLADNNCYNIDFWGPISNFGIPIAAVMDTQKSPELFVPSVSPSRSCGQGRH
jgi:hypothetical protein